MEHNEECCFRRSAGLARRDAGDFLRAARALNCADALACSPRVSESQLKRITRRTLELKRGVWHKGRMHGDEIRQLLHASPFRPFTVYLASEKAFAVPHEDFALLTPKGRTLIVSYSDREAVELLDVALIARVEVQDQKVSGS